ncbi:hypothetical protein Cal6303_3599 [Calothrix sp. PCC 6303]|nr:hypothetical protein Cal6303_3599 [Calothrix sp. PCC 6303]
MGLDSVAKDNFLGIHGVHREKITTIVLEVIRWKPAMYIEKTLILKMMIFNQVGEFFHESRI